MGACLLAGLACTIASLCLLVMAVLEVFRAQQPADAPTAAFAIDGDDRSLTPLVLRKPRHYQLHRTDGPNGTTAAPEPAKAAPPTNNHPPPLVPAFFVYGDSTVDVGNNNYLRTMARANLAPYGRDFDTHQPTGRFSNGRLSIDFLAMLLGLPFAPPILSRVNVTTSMRGVNFASAGAGILERSGSDLGEHIPMNDQIRSVYDVLNRLAPKIGAEAADEIVSKSIHYISVGSNDYIHYYLQNVSAIQNTETSFEFSQGLTVRLSSDIERLYRRGIRKMVAIGIGPLGCVPFYLFKFNRTKGGCVDSINFMISEYNNALRVAVQDIARRHKGLRIIYCDVLQSLLPVVKSPAHYGFLSARTACCGLGAFGGWVMCLHPQMACNDADSYLWWDEFHPTHKANSLLANDIWNGSVCEPFGLRQLATA